MPLVFDVYGTLLDVDAAAREAIDTHPQLEATWPELSARWRQRQLSYSWLRSLMQDYIPFWQITCDALDVTLDELAINDAKLHQTLLDLYLHLSAFEEVPEILAQLQSQGHQLAVLSNGDPMMLNIALQSAGIDGFLDGILSVDSLRCYKPDPKVYELVTDTYDCQPQDVLFFSSNNWDIAGASQFGFRPVWINRGQKIWDKLSPAPSPPHGQTAAHLKEAVDRLNLI